jgi:hypothetical protein
MKRSLVAGVGLVVVAVVGTGAFLLSHSVPESPEQAFELFLARDVAEDQIMDPLLLGGDGVIPLLVEAIPDRDMERRRYAIGALANLRADAAIPTLRGLARDASEPDYIRCDALSAVALISQASGVELANEFRGNAVGCLAETSEAIVSDDYADWSDHHYMRRTYVEALLGWHY